MSRVFISASLTFLPLETVPSGIEIVRQATLDHRGIDRRHNHHNRPQGCLRARHP
jgi:hypothetical protein